MTEDLGYFYAGRRRQKYRLSESFASMALKCNSDKQLTKFIKDARRKFSSDLSAPFIGHTLMLAVKHNRRDIVVRFVSEGARVNVWIKGETLLHGAIRANNLPIVRYLLSRPDINRVALDKSERTPVMLASRGKPECLKLLLDAGCGVHHFDNLGYQAIHQYLYIYRTQPFDGKMVDCLDLLVKHGADVSAYCDYGVTCLHKAVEGRLFSFVGWLIGNNARLDKPVAPGGVDYLNENLQGPYYTLHLNVKDHGHCLTPLFFAVFLGIKPMIDVLIACGSTYTPFVTMLKASAPSASVYLKLNLDFSTLGKRPPSLMKLSRNVIRRQLSSNIVEDVTQLGLPNKLQDFVLCTTELNIYKDLIEVPASST